MASLIRLKKTPQAKNPNPEDPALISPPMGGVYLRPQMEWWNGGMVE